MIPLTDEEIIYYEKQKLCHICKKEFCYDKNEKNKFKLYQKVRDHCHYTGKFRGPAHSICNLRYINLSEINNKECKKNAWKEIKLDQNVNSLVLKIID